jgi:hypothetical protein
MIKYYDGPDCYPWREVFALWPVLTVTGKWVWLRKVYKRKFYSAGKVVGGGNFHLEPFVEYSDIFDILINDEQ